MTYFNPDEEVLNIELTPYGKYLYSQGKFKPSKYTFSDEDIVYNIAQASGSATFKEEQNLSNPRIVVETPYTKPTPRKVAVVKKETSFIPSTKGLDPSLISTSETLNTQEEMYIGSQRTMISSLGNMNYDSTEAPKLKFAILNGEKIIDIDLTLQPQDVSIGNLQTGGHPDLAIPQIDLDYVIRTSIVSSERPEKLFNVDEESVFINGVPTLPGPTFSDGGSVIKQTNEYYFLIEEENTPNMMDSFSIEVYEVMPEIDEYTKNNKLRQLKFFKDPEEVRVNNNILLSQEEVQPLLEQLNTMSLGLNDTEATTNVTNYINIFTDYYDEISLDIICNYISSLRNKGFALDTTIQCPDKLPVNQIAYDIYATDGVISEEC